MQQKQFLDFFGFDRSTYSSDFKRNNGRREWRWYAELKEQKVRDIETEIHSPKRQKANTIIVNIPMSYYDYGLLLT